MLRYVYFLLALLPALAMYTAHVLLRSWIDPRRSAMHLAAFIFLHILGAFLIVFLFGMIFRFIFSH
jgi:hypothetical protein